MPDRGLTLSSDNEEFLLKQRVLCPQRERLFSLKERIFLKGEIFLPPKEEIDFLCLDTTFGQSLFEIQTLK